MGQHICGKHGKGWHALCGAHLDWQPKMFRHKKCDKCKKFQDKAKSQAEKLAARWAKK